MVSTARHEDVFRNEGELRLFSGNQPFLLNAQDGVFLVDEGAVNVFAVRLAAGNAAGARRHLYRVGTGAILMGLDIREPADSLGLLAVPLINTRTLRIPCSRFVALLAEDGPAEGVVALLGDWIAGLATGLPSRLPPKDVVKLEAGAPVALSSGQAACVSGTMLWVRHLDGSSSLMGHEDVPITAETHFIPQAGGMWLEAREPATVEVTATVDYARRNPGLPGLARFHGRILDLIFRLVEQGEEREKERWRRQARAEQKSLHGTLLDIVSIMDTGAGEASPPTSLADEPLLRACRMVGHELDIAITAPGAGGGGGPEARLEEIARASRVRVRRVLLAGEWWREDHGPLLAFWQEDGRPVALLQQREKCTLLRDPEDGAEERLVDEKIAGRLSPFAFQMYRPLPDGPVSALALLRFVGMRVRKDFHRVLGMGVLGALVSLIIPVSTGIVYNSIIPEAARGQMVQLALILLACASGVALLEAVKALALLRIETRADADSQAAIMDRMLSLPVSFFREYTSGDLAERALGLTAIRESVSLFTIQSGLAGLFALLNLGLMFWYDKKLALVAAAFVSLGVVVLTLLNVKQVRRLRNVTAIEGRITGMVLQFISGISKLRVAGAEVSAFSRWAREFSRQRRFAYQAKSLGNLQAVFNAVFPALGLLVIFGWISKHPNPDLRTGDVLAFLAAYTNLQAALFQVVAAFAGILGVVPLFERMRPLLQTPPELDESKASPGELAGQLEIRDITFRYQENGPTILRNVSLEIMPGRFIAVVGGSGSGKSTLLRLLLGFEKTQSGGVYYDGKDLATLDCREVRRQIGVVLQGGSVTPGSIFDNIRGAYDFSVDDAWEAARQAGLDDDIRNMPMGMYTYVSPGGETLSGGQRQRLLIARALIRKPRILFFDEATSALDNRTQEIVSNSLGQSRATRVVIAHRLSTVINADCIHVLEKGRIVESGRYDELMRNDGVFAALVRRQII